VLVTSASGIALLDATVALAAPIRSGSIVNVNYMDAKNCPRRRARIVSHRNSSPIFMGTQ
jgi:hypothetical protein